MTYSQAISITRPSAAPIRIFRVRQIALPTEHGGWGFLLEPLVAGLAIAFSVTAPWIALMTIGAFLTRQPLKVLFLDRRGMRNRDRARVALSFCLLYSAIFFVGLAGTLMTGGWRILLPFLFVLPFVFLQIYADVSRKSRHLFPELTGAVTISASIAAIALAAGLSWANAIALWVIFSSRLIPSILYIRQRLLLEKGKKYSTVVPTIADVAGLLAVLALAYNGLSPILVVFAMILLLYRAVVGLSRRRTKLRAMQIGVREVVYGALTVLSVVIGHYTGF